MCFHGNRHPSSIKHLFISLYSKYQSFMFICLLICMSTTAFKVLSHLYPRPALSDQKSGLQSVLSGLVLALRTNKRMSESPSVFQRTLSHSRLLPGFLSLQFTIMQSRATGIADHILPLGNLLMSKMINWW